MRSFSSFRQAEFASSLLSSKNAHLSSFLYPDRHLYFLASQNLRPNIDLQCPAFLHLSYLYLRHHRYHQKMLICHHFCLRTDICPFEHTVMQILLHFSYVHLRHHCYRQILLISCNFLALTDTRTFWISEPKNLRISDSPNIRVPESSNLRICESANLRIRESANPQIRESANLRICEYANLRVGASAHLRICASAHMRICALAHLRICESANTRLWLEAGCRFNCLLFLVLATCICAIIVIIKNQWIQQLYPYFVKI
jgi:hypothetical protein